MSSNLPVAIVKNDAITYEQARSDLQTVKEAFKRSPTYNNALAIQKAQRTLDNVALAERKEFMVVQGDKGHDYRTEETITVSALREIILQVKENGGKNPDGALLMINRLANQALIASGRHDG